MCCSVLQCVAVGAVELVRMLCCSVLQRVAVSAVELVLILELVCMQAYHIHSPHHTKSTADASATVQARPELHRVSPPRVAPSQPATYRAASFKYIYIYMSIHIESHIQSQSTR